MRTADPVSSKPASPLRRREFKIYFVGNATSNLGNWLNTVVLAVYMHNLTHSSFWVGLTGFGLFTPVLFLALPSGVAADRFDRLRLLLGSQVMAMGLATLLAVMVWTEHADRYVVTAIAFGFGISTAIAIPAMQALIPNLVPREELGDAIRLNALTFNLARALGPVAGVGFIVWLGPTWAFAINAASYAVLVGALIMVRTPPFPRAHDTPPGPIREGIAYAWRHLRTRWTLLAIVAIGVTLDPITTLSPALAQSYHLATGGAGWIVASWGAGAVIAILTGRSLIRGMTEHGLGWMGLLALAVGMAALGASPSIWFAIPAGVLTGAGYISATMAFTTSMQQDVPESLRGRVSALWTLAFLGPRAVMAVVDGAVADVFGPHWTTAAFGLFALAAAMFLRRVETSHAELVPPPA